MTQQDSKEGEGRQEEYSSAFASEGEGPREPRAGGGLSEGPRVIFQNQKGFERLAVEIWPDGTGRELLRLEKPGQGLVLHAQASRIEVQDRRPSRDEAEEEVMGKIFEAAAAGRLDAWQLRAYREMGLRLPGPRPRAARGILGKCRECGCTEERACPPAIEGGRACHWVEPGLCSRCAPPEDREMSREPATTQGNVPPSGAPDPFAVFEQEMEHERILRAHEEALCAFESARTVTRGDSPLEGVAVDTIQSILPLFRRANSGSDRLLRARAELSGSLLAMLTSAVWIMAEAVEALAVEDAIAPWENCDEGSRDYHRRSALARLDSVDPDEYFRLVACFKCKKAVDSPEPERREPEDPADGL